MSTKRTSVQVDEHTELRPASSPGFWEMWVGGVFVGMYYSLERARQAAGSHYGDVCRRKYSALLTGGQQT